MQRVARATTLPRRLGVFCQKSTEKLCEDLLKNSVWRFCGPPRNGNGEREIRILFERCRLISFELYCIIKYSLGE